MVGLRDCAVLTRFVDTHIGEIVAHLKEPGLHDEIMIIISADHCENHGEPGIYSEQGTAGRATCRIPLIINGPGIRTTT